MEDLSAHGRMSNEEVTELTEDFQGKFVDA